MTILPSTFFTARQVGLAVLLLLLAGCATPQRQVGITSPPPPRTGSIPISAYDDYARATAPAITVSREPLTLISAR